MILASYIFRHVPIFSLSISLTLLVHFLCFLCFLLDLHGCGVAHRGRTTSAVLVAASCRHVRQAHRFIPSVEKRAIFVHRSFELVSLLSNFFLENLVLAKYEGIAPCATKKDPRCSSRTGFVTSSGTTARDGHPGSSVSRDKLGGSHFAHLSAPPCSARSL